MTKKFSPASFIEADLNERIADMPDIFDGLKCVYELKVDDESWHLDLKNKKAPQISKGPTEDADCSIEMSGEHFEKLAHGKLNIPMAVITGKFKIKGSKGLALKLVELFR